MSLFELAIDRVLENEGGYDNDPADPGGETKYGICKRSYPNLDIKNLTIQEAKHIYERDFWDANQLSKINSQVVASKVFDMCVNMGSYRGIELLQQAIDTLGESVNEDGKMGPVTIMAVNRLEENQLHLALKQVCRNFYNDLVERHPKLRKFLRSWLHRADQ